MLWIYVLSHHLSGHFEAALFCVIPYVIPAVDISSEWGDTSLAPNLGVFFLVQREEIILLWWSVGKMLCTLVVSWKNVSCIGDSLHYIGGQ